MPPHELGKHAADAVAGGLTLFALLSQAAQAVNPILIAFSTVLSIAWLIIRIAQWWRTGRTEET